MPSLEESKIYADGIDIINTLQAIPQELMGIKEALERLATLSDRVMSILEIPDMDDSRGKAASEAAYYRLVPCFTHGISCCDICWPEDEPLGDGEDPSLG